MTRILKIATRGSTLARVQAQSLKQALLKAHSGLAIELVEVTTTGDLSARRDENLPTAKDDFVKELETALLDEEVDVAVHSMKDVPLTHPNGLATRSIGLRADARDALIGCSSPFELSIDAKIGTSSCRRKALLNYVFNRSSVSSIRGNVGTRLNKLASGNYDALVLAAAGMQRLNLEDRIGCYLDPSVFVPSPGQGALAAEYLVDNREVQSLLVQCTNTNTQIATQAERSIVAAVEADCTAPIGVYCERFKDGWRLHTVVLNQTGTQALQLQLKGECVEKLVAESTDYLLNAGARELFQN